VQLDKGCNLQPLCLMGGVHGQHTNVYFNPCNCNWDNDMLILSPEFSSVWCLVIIDLLFFFLFRFVCIIQSYTNRQPHVLYPKFLFLINNFLGIAKTNPLMAFIRLELSNLFFNFFFWSRIFFLFYLTNSVHVQRGD
jgi:hypothetical protein